MLWVIAMLVALPLCLRGAKLRVWLVLMAACGAAWVFPNIAAHIAIDLLAGAAVLKRPRGLAQKAIGLLFVVMLTTSTGFILSDQLNPSLLQSLMIFWGWLQWLALLSWGIYDLVGNYRRGPSASGRVHAVDAGRIRE